MRTYPHSDYYRDRSSETELCNDFPLDRMYIEGLYAMQAHMWNNGVNLDIPVVRVMNTAHFLAAYMFATTCDGDQLEYDMLANDSLGRDRKMFKVAIIVLAAMLAHTEGFRARNCRDMLLENRDPDFEEGITLYDRFLKSAQRRFEEEDFLIDTHTQIQKLIAENEQLAAENIQLKWTITTMENQQNNQYNHCIIYNAPVYNTTNNYAAPQESQQVQSEETRVESRSANDILGIPREGKYTEVRKYIEERKRFDEEFKLFCENSSLRDLCKRLTKEFGWFVDENSLQKNLNRHI